MLTKIKVFAYIQRQLTKNKSHFFSNGGGGGRGSAFEEFPKPSPSSEFHAVDDMNVYQQENTPVIADVSNVLHKISYLTRWYHNTLTCEDVRWNTLTTSMRFMINSWNGKQLKSVKKQLKIVKAVKLIVNLMTIAAL